MILFGYALSGDMSGVALGLVDGGGHAALRAHIESIQDFDILYLGSQSDAEKLITEGRLDGAVLLRPEGVRVLLDASSLQIAGAIAAAVQAGVSKEKAVLQKTQESPIITRYIFGYDLKMMDTVGPAILGLVVFFFTFINAAIAFIRERSQGTLEKFMVSPLSRVEMVSGYVLGFSVFTILQSATTLFVVTFGFGVPLQGSPLTALAVVLLLGAGALVLGSFFSNFARSEFQVVQFIPLIITPQIVLCGIRWRCRNRRAARAATLARGVDRCTAGWRTASPNSNWRAPGSSPRRWTISRIEKMSGARGRSTKRKRGLPTARASARACPPS